MATAYFNRFTFNLTTETAQACSHAGDCDDDVAIAVCDPDVAAELERIGESAIANELREYGAWSDEELADTSENAMRITWLAAGQIADNLTEGQ